MKKLYNTKKYVSECQEILDIIMSNNAAGNDWQAQKDTLLPLVKFLEDQELSCPSEITGTEPDIYHFSSQLKAIAKKINTPEVWELKRIAEEEPQKIELLSYIQLILENWDELKAWSITYRCLHDIVVLKNNWDESKFNELIRIIKRLD